MHQFSSELDKGAEFSADRRYRFALWRVWDKSQPLVMFIGLNPSNADEQADDPTTRRVTRFAYDLGYGGFFLMNLFPRVATNPKELIDFRKDTTDASVDECNDEWLDKVSRECERIIFAWGSFVEAKERAALITAKYKGYVLGFNRDGSPKHPLYVPAGIVPFRMPG